MDNTFINRELGSTLLDAASYFPVLCVTGLNQTSGGMMIDEVQRVPELLSYIQGIVDNHPERRFVLSGSSNFALLRSVSQSLAGRTGMFELLPMAYSEVREHLSELTLDEILFNGLYPAICAKKNTARFLYPCSMLRNWQMKWA